MQRPDYRALADHARPSLELVGLDDNAVESLRRLSHTSNPPVLVRAIRGSRCRTLRAMTDELAAALQLPLYTGPSWSALEDVLRDVPEDTGSDVVLIATEALQVLADADDPDDLATLFDVVAGIDAAGAANGTGRFRLLLTEGPYRLGELRERVRGSWPRHASG